MPDAKSPLPLIAQLRFQLDQLGARNAHHEFEHLCRHFARQAITPNILPATGPVSGGGDQGRDFETFTTFVRDAPDGSYFFAGEGGSKPLVFACTLTAKVDLPGKIKADVRTICGAGAPHIIYCFSNQDLPVPKRHALQAWSLEECHCRLEIFDAQALAEQLSRAELFWIAEEYLHVASDLLPAPGVSGGAAYDKARARWLDGSNVPANFADFIEVKLGLRRATFTERLKPDLARWINVMETFLTQEEVEDLQRRAAYEICVATLRGFHDLTPRRALVERYFAEWGQPSGVGAALQDAVILFVYCSAAASCAELEIDDDSLAEWCDALIVATDRVVAEAPGPNSRAEGLLARAQLAMVLVSSETDHAAKDFDDVFGRWFELVDAAEKAPLFPVEPLADLLTNVMPMLGRDSRFVGLTSRVDELLGLRSSGYIVAEKCRDRALAYMEAGNALEAIAEFQRAKVKWFTGDALRGSILSQLALSDAYLGLGLVYAAKYHALSAVFLVARTDGDELRGLLPGAFAQLGRCVYAGGEWVTFSEHFRLHLIAHYQWTSDPDDWARQPSIQSGVAHFVVMRALAKVIGGEAASAILEAPLLATEMPEDLRAEILDPPLPVAAYEALTSDEIQARMAKELWGPAFADCGATREYRWRALGIHWTVHCPNDLRHIPAVEEFVAVLQIAIADIARFELCLLPATVALDVGVTSAREISLDEVAGKTRLSYRIELPEKSASSLEAMSQAQGQILSVATAILLWCSALPEDGIRRLLDETYADGLPNKVMLARPYRELFLECCARSEFNERRAKPLGRAQSEGFALREAPELAWRAGPGPGYDRALSLANVVARYRRAQLPVEKTLLRLRRTERFAQWVGERRGEGMLDWQILTLIANAVASYRVPVLPGPDMQKELTALKAMMNRAEMDADPPYPEAELYRLDLGMARKMGVAAVAQ